jgi:hypothetical protein
LNIKSILIRHIQFLLVLCQLFSPLVLQSGVRLDQLLTALWISIDDKKDKNENEIENKHANGATKAVNVATANAFAEEDTVMVIVIHAHLAIITMFHVFFYVDVAFYTVEHFYFLAIFAFSVLPLGLVISCVDCFF